jgi:hypothetical protein
LKSFAAEERCFPLKREMIRWWVAALQLAELFVSSLVHLLYGFYIFSTAVAGDLSLALNDCLFKPNMNVEVKENVPRGPSANAENLPPIVLVHGIFGFGKGVLPIFLIFTRCLQINIIHFFLFNWDFHFVSFGVVEIGRFIVLRGGREEG